MYLFSLLGVEWMLWMDDDAIFTDMNFMTLNTYLFRCLRLRGVLLRVVVCGVVLSVTCFSSRCGMDAMDSSFSFLYAAIVLLFFLYLSYDTTHTTKAEH